MIVLWVLLIFAGTTAFLYGLLNLRRSSDTPAE